MMKKTLALLSLSLPFLAFANPCLELIVKLTNPPPAIAIITKGEKLSYELIDPKERQKLLMEYRKETEKIYELLTEYITKRQEVEEAKKYLSWQWKRVEIGVEYKKDIWREQIQLNKDIQKLNSLKLQLILFGAKEEELEKCYRSSKF